MLKSISLMVVNAYISELEKFLERFLKLPLEEKLIIFIEFCHKNSHNLQIEFKNSKIHLGTKFGINLVTLDSANILDINNCMIIIVCKLKTLDYEHYIDDNTQKILDAFCTMV